MLRSNPSTINIDGIVYQIENGELKIPQFQRDFVWSISATAQLMDSIIKGYPIGAFTFWRTKDRLRTIKNVGGLQLPDSPANDYVNYVLDGQQRITSIYACIKGVVIGNDDYSQFFVDLTSTEDDPIVRLDSEGLQMDEYISLKELLAGGMAMIVSRFGSNTLSLERIDEYKKRINNYAFSTIEIQDAPLDIATEIFTRINTTGKSLSVFEIMCAKTYDEEKNFDLSERRKVQLEKWEGVNYETVPHQTVLQVVSLCINKTCRRRDILSIKKDDFIDVWEKVDKAFDETIDYFKSYYGIPVSKLLPYDALLVPFAYYFYFNGTKPTGKNAQNLEDYFWRCVLTKRFTEGVEGKLAIDVSNIIEPILKNDVPDEKSLEAVDISFENIKRNGEFSLSSAYIKGLICIMAAQHPRSFSDGAEVVIDNAWLSQSNSKNYHHFFPKAYMKKNKGLIPDEKVNHIANITIVDGYLNKNRIKDKAPSVYMEEFKEENSTLNDAMKTHLITDLDAFGIWKDDYDLFFENRINKICGELKRRIIIRSYDKE